MNAYPETLVARVVGVKKKRLAAMRGEKLERGPDWQFEDPRVGVVYSPDGLKKLCGLLGLDAAALAWPQDAAAPAQPSEPAPAETEASAATERPAAAEISAFETPSGDTLAFTDYGAGPIVDGLEPLAAVDDAPAEPEKIAEPAPALPPGAPPAVNPPHDPVVCGGPADVVAALVEARVEDLAHQEQARPLVVLRVRKIPLNPHLILARLEGGTTDVRVRVKTNVNFIPGMPIRARAPAAGSDVYSHEGHCPRRRGHY